MVNQSNEGDSHENKLHNYGSCSAQVGLLNCIETVLEFTPLQFLAQPKLNFNKIKSMAWGQ